MMSCEEFERQGLDMDRPDATPEEAALASEHAERCPDCNALLASWREVKADLRLLRETTFLESAPARVEMRLKQELRTRREARVPRSSVAIASWALAAAAVVAAAVGWMHWRQPALSPTGQAGAPLVAAAVPGDEGSADPMLLADYDPASFTQLPGSMPSVSSDQSVVQVRMQRGALMQFGLPVEPEQASEWVDVDFLVGEDGQPVAVRLHQDSQGDVEPE
jgi:hypothetical protein